MPQRDGGATPPGGSTGRPPRRAPSARRQRWEMALGILGFFTLVSLVFAVVAELRGEPALAEVIVLLFFLGATYYAYRSWQRSD